MLSASVDQISTQTASALFERQDGAILTDIVVNGTTTTERLPDGTTTQQTGFGIGLTISDTAHGELILSTGGIAASSTLTIAPNLGSAHLHAVCFLYSQVGAPLTLTVDLNFASTSKTTAASFTDHEGNTTEIIHALGRDATATGTVAISDYFALPNQVINVTSFQGSIQEVDTTIITNGSNSLVTALFGSTPILA